MAKSNGESFRRAFDVYAIGQLILRRTLGLTDSVAGLDWARDDLRDVLLDLKLAVIELDRGRADHHMGESMAIVADIRKLLES